MDKHRMLLELLRTVEGLPKADELEIREFVDHSEWGLALETICAAILGERLVVSRRAYEMIATLGKAMDMKPSLWTRIAGFVQGSPD